MRRVVQITLIIHKTEKQYGYAILLYLKRQNWYVMHFNMESYSRWNGLYIQPD